MILRGRAEEIPGRIDRLVSGRSRQALSLSPPLRAALKLELSNDRPPTRGDRRMRTAAAASLGEPADRALLPAETATAPSETPPPILSKADGSVIERVIEEYKRRDFLEERGLRPTRTMLLSGPPGVGKSMTIDYLALALGHPIVRVEPAAVIGSLLGESARLLSAAFERARSLRAVMVLDEVDALAKRRDDVHDVGEFKRFVSTLLLELDRWPGESLLVAATNHFDLLDPALERRFELHLRIAYPDAEARAAILARAIEARRIEVSQGILDALVGATDGKSGAWIDSLVNRAARHIALSGDSAERVLLIAALPDAPQRLQRPERARLAAAIRTATGMPFRDIGAIFDCSHTAARRLVATGEAML